MPLPTREVIARATAIEETLPMAAMGLLQANGCTLILPRVDDGVAILPGTGALIRKMMASLSLLLRAFVSWWYMPFQLE